ncbi:hypothetical protein XANCAGTX0491_008128 [Xanthoria calcicola]
MFSYLRSNNRRSALPTASHPHTAPSRHVHSLHGSTEDLLFRHAYRTSNQSNPSPISPDPPVLPPIPRVASQHESGKEDDVEAPFIFDAIESENKFQVKQESPDFHSSRYDEPRSNGSIGCEQRPPTLKKTAIDPPPSPLQINPQSQNRQLRLLQAKPLTMRSQSEPFSKHTQIRSQEQTSEGTQPARAPPPPPLRLSSGPGANGAQIRQGRTRLNLLNPMALLAKRRSHHAAADSHAEKAQHKVTRSTVPGIPDDFDPRIRGKVVHDFSAPRPGTNDSSNRARGSDKQRDAILYSSRRPSPNASTSFADDDSPSSGEREHTPQFKEHFDEDYEPLKYGPAKQRTSAFMYQVSLSESQPNPDPYVLPPFARHLPSNISTAPSGVHQSSPPPQKKSLEIVPESTVAATVPTDKPLASTPPSSPPVKARSRASSNTDSSYQPAGLPKHFKSNASRFSFDLSGVGSAAQEKLLEDKHRQHERDRARRSHRSQSCDTRVSGRDSDDDEVYANQYDDVEDDDGIEERIPGVNADEDETAPLVAYQHTRSTGLVSPCKSSLTNNASLASTGISSSNTPRDSMGIHVSPSTTQMPPDRYSQAPNAQHLNPDPLHESCTTSLQNSSHGRPASVSESGVNPSAPAPNDEDDLYFDDGMIEGLDVSEDHPFDESIFDDDASTVYGLPLRDRNPMSTGIDFPPDEQKFKDPSFNVHRDSKDSLNNIHLHSLSFSELQKSSAQPDQVNGKSLGASANVTNNAGYLDALTVGINQAALSGKFDRWPSLHLGSESGFDDKPGSSEAYRHSGPGEDASAEGAPISGGIQDMEDFAFDDALADDPIIAAANAEALENDDEGFYGQEFGFFARASGAGEAEYANGGYFGSGGFDGIGRSHSGRNNEPSLTPITERSEWSNRNSAISLAMHGFQQPHSAGPQSSAGLAQLADLMRLEDDDLSLSALMKLRRGAWGGSNASLHSSSSGSPLTYAPGVGFPAAIQLQQSNSSNGNINLQNGSPLTMYTGHVPAASSYSLVSSNGYASSPDDSQPSPASPTTTSSVLQQGSPTQQPPQSAPAFLPQQQHLAQQPISMLSPPSASFSHQSHRRSMSPVKRSSMGPPPRPSKGHSRNSSNASESVSYMLEAGSEDGGQGRWVLEKRRTDESGVVEVLGREIVEGGRI